MKRILLTAALALGLSATGAAALPHFACQKAGEVAHKAMAYRQAGYSFDQTWEALGPDIAEIRLQARFFGFSEAQLDFYERVAHDQLLPIVYNIKVLRTQKARDRVATKAGETAYARCRAQ